MINFTNFFTYNIGLNTQKNLVKNSLNFNKKIFTKTLRIPSSAQSGAISGGVYPIKLGELEGLESHGRNFLIQDSNGNNIPYFRIEKNHIAAMDGAWIFYSSPSVIYDANAGNSGQIFIGVCTHDGRRNIIEYDIENKKYTIRTLNTSALQVDDHNQPALCINGDGKLVVAYTEHPGAMKVQVSNNAHDLSAGFTTAVNPVQSGNSSYAYLWRLQSTGEIYLWSRLEPTKKWFLSKSTDEGATWSDFVQTMSPSVLIANNYNQMYSDGIDKVWITMNETKPNGEEPFNRAVYCFYYNGSNYISPSGTVIGSEINGTGSLPLDSVIYPYDESDPNKRSVSDIMIDLEGKPRILFYLYPNGNEESNHQLWHARWTGSEWIKNIVVDEGPYFVDPSTGSESYPGSGRFNRSNINEICTAVTVNGKKEIQIFNTIDDGLTWFKTLDVTTNSIEHNFRPLSPHLLTPEVNSMKNVPHWFWMGNGVYNDYNDFKNNIKSYPADYAFGAMVKIDLPGDSDVDLIVKSGGVNLNETINLFDDLGMEMVHIGAMRFNDSCDTNNMVQYSTSFWTKKFEAPRSIDISESVWPSWDKSNSGGYIVFDPSYHGESELSTVWIGQRDGNNVEQHLIANNVASPLAISILRLSSLNRLQSNIYQTSAFSTVTADTSVGTDFIVCSSIFQQGVQHSIRYGTTEKTIVPSNQSINNSGSTSQATVGIRNTSSLVTPLDGRTFICMQGRSVLTKIYTDTLNNAISDPDNFAITIN